jgi:hypothetical protein
MVDWHYSGNILASARAWRANAGVLPAPPEPFPVRRRTAHVRRVCLLPGVVNADVPKSGINGIKRRSRARWVPKVGSRVR